MNNTNNNGTTALMCAAMNGHDKCVELLIREGANVNSHDNEGFTVLMRAAYGGHVRTLCELIKAGADVNALYGNVTALTMVASDGFEICMKELIKAGADMNKPDDTGMTPLMHATINSRVKCVRTLIAAEANTTYKNKHGATALSFCTDVECLEALLQAGANVNEPDRRDYTPLIEAAFHANYDYLERLLLAGANVNAIALDGFTALMRVLWHSSAEYEHRARSTSQRYSLQHYDVDRCVSLFVDAGANVNIALTSGSTALHHAVTNDHWESFLRLIRAGADVNHCDAAGSTALTIAASLWREDYMQELIKAGAYVNVTLSPVMTVVSRSPCRGATVSQYDKACRCIKLLVEAGADVNMTDQQGETALTAAAYNNCPPSILKVLIEAGADVNLLNDN